MTLQISTKVMFWGSWIKCILENLFHFQSDYSNLPEIRKKHLFHFSVIITGEIWYCKIQRFVFQSYDYGKNVYLLLK